MARALAVRWSLSKVTVMVFGNPVSRPRSVSTETAAWVVGVGAGDGGGRSRSLWRRVWCLRPQGGKRTCLGSSCSRACQKSS